MDKRPAKSLNILLAEDDELSQQMVSILFDLLGYSVDVAFNGVEAITAVKSRNYDLIFMDVEMPVVDGLEATRAIRAMEFGRNDIPIIAMTAHARDEQRCFDAGMDDYISKPLDSKRISQVITACLQGRYRRRTAFLTAFGSDKPPEDAPLLDVSSALPMFNNDPIQYQGFMEEFLGNLPDRLKMIDITYSNKDWDMLGNEAHKLKGVSATMGAIRLSALASKLDIIAKERAIAQAGELIQQIKTVVAELTDKAIATINNKR